MKKICILGTVGIPAKYGGFETLTEYLTKYLNKKYDITVFCSSKSYTKELENYNGVKLKYINLQANGVQSIPYDIISLYKSLRFADTILILGVSGCIALPILRLFNKKVKIITNIDGLEWKRQKWTSNAKKFLKYSEKLAVKYSDIVVSDNKVIQDYVMSEYDVKSELIAYGADHVTKETVSEELFEKYPFLKEKYAFKVCRIEPENNIHLILEAFSEYKDLNLIIIGNWTNSEYGKNLKDTYSKFENIYLFDPIYDQNILNQIRSNCYIYMHGHSAGGTNPSLVEAMYLSLPIFAYGIDYNKSTTENKAKYFDNKLQLIELLRNMNDDELKNIGKYMEKVSNENYRWEKISQQYANIF